ncbi:MAG: DUF1800 domain-containing protein [Candidatus Pseudobacter hemicellulosilyticus]|uniref:DUF1800 domain-containing protein n=1 Tax=Candidatus Pseudobacter hemicellulosilyticus TaxID=3121375 RepID=A0AAJ5WSS8_9BACT|nr:MAG: DUF1800 domain-containing protein [Pseudobacter sp.]
MDRRAFFRQTRKTGPPATSGENTYATQPRPAIIAGGRGISTGLDPYSGPWTPNEVAHLLKRTGFGATQPDIDHFINMTPDQAVDALLQDTSPLPAPPLKVYDTDGIDGGDPDLTVAHGQTWVNTHALDTDVEPLRIQSWKNWWVGGMLRQERSITEKMVLFWHNHFATETAIYNNGIYAYRHYSLLRTQALGNFKQLVRAVTLDLAMLRYLDGYLNSGYAPDENYARELQELFTLGKENNPNYTEQDVLAAARVLTGWRINLADDTVYFDPAQHDAKPKKFSSFYGGASISGGSDATAGDTELDALLDLIFGKAVEVSEFLIGKLYRYFCYYTIDEYTKNNVIQPLARQFRENGWNIKPILATLLKSEHFFDPLSQGCLIKSPLDFLVGLCREFNVVFPDSSQPDQQYALWEFIRTQSGDMQQNPGDPPGVSGWPAYYQLPVFHEMWINSDTLPRRNTFSDLLILNGYTREGAELKIDPVAFAGTLPNPADPNALINDSLAILYRVPLSAASRDSIKKQLLLSNQVQDYYWSNAWNAHINNPNDKVAYETVFNRLQALYKYFMNLAEYQLA